MIRASAPYTSGLGGFELLKIDCVRVARGGSLSTLHRVRVNTSIVVLLENNQGVHELAQNSANRAKPRRSFTQCFLEFIVPKSKIYGQKNFF